MWALAYFTLFIKISDFGNRFMGALTSLLVLAALLSSINSSLPQTSYFKHIDVWFFWFIINIVIIIFVHIVVDYFVNPENIIKPKNPMSSRYQLEKENSEEKKRSLKINKIAKITLPIHTLAFTAVYFGMTRLN